MKCGIPTVASHLRQQSVSNFQSVPYKKNVDYRLVPPWNHRQNAAERAIQTFKNHFIAGLCSTHREFLMHLWGRLLPQAVITLNLLRASRWNPKLSAHQQLNKKIDFNRTPLAPPGTKVIVHEAPDARPSWAPHGKHAWYIGLSSKHYRCYKVYVPSTRGERDSDTVQFFPDNGSIPFLSSADLAAYASLDLIAAIKNPHPETPLFVGDNQLRALTQLADIFATSLHPKIFPQILLHPG